MDTLLIIIGFDDRCHPGFGRDCGCRSHRRWIHYHYFGGAGRSRVGCRLHHEVISVASIFSSFGPVMKRTMHFR
jgi:hypothetical protein